VTRAATRYIANADLAVGGFYSSDTNLIFGNQVSAERILIGERAAIYPDGVRRRGWLVAHIENLIAGAEILAGIAMASQTPLHLQGFRLVHQGHLIDWTVAGVATDALGDVNAVIEVDEVRELVDPGPLQRFAGTIAGADGLKELSVVPNLRVTVHARLGRGDSGEAGGLDRGVTIAAVDAESGDVMLMAEWDRLRLADAGIGHKGRALHDVNDSAQCRNDEYGAENGGARKRIRAAMKDLRHSLMRSSEETRRSFVV
jgi:hypothetical protein